jgi:branched chain amino acid efflux pump
VRRGFRAGLPFVLPTFILGISFGVLAEPVMGPAASIVFSGTTVAGGAQFAALSVLGAGGSALAAIVAGLLMNARFLPMGLAFGASLRGSAAKRVASGQAVIDTSWAMARRPDGTFDRELLIGATLPQVAGWFLGTVVGVLAGPVLGEPEKLGIDAIFPAFYLALLVEEVRDRRTLTAALAGGAITLALLPVAPPGLPVVAASIAALLGLRSR